MRVYGLLFSLLGLIAGIALIHAYGVFSYGYWQYWWLDVLIHFLGGAWIAGMFLWIFPQHGRVAGKIEWSLFASVLGIVLFAGIIWEVFEILIGATSVSVPNYVTDTVTDLVAGIAGAAVVSVFYK